MMLVLASHRHITHSKPQKIHTCSVQATIMFRTDHETESSLGDKIESTWLGKSLFDKRRLRSCLGPWPANSAFINSDNLLHKITRLPYRQVTTFKLYHRRYMYLSNRTVWRLQRRLHQSFPCRHHALMKDKSLQHAGNDYQPH